MRRIFLLAVSLGAVALAASYGYLRVTRQAEGKVSPQGPVRGGTYLASLSVNPPTFDPGLASDTTSVTCVLQLFDGLVRFDMSGSKGTGGDGRGNIVAGIAHRWEISDDGLTYTFHLREDVRFHDTTEGGRATANGGRRVVASDVKFSFERVLVPELKSTRAQVFEVIEGSEDFINGRAGEVRGLRAVDDKTLEIQLKQPYAPFLATLTMPNASVVPREDVERWGEDFGRHPVGTGPFRFERFIENDSVQMSAFQAYFGGAPYLDKLVFHIFQEETQRFQAFLDRRLFHTTVPDPRYNVIKDDPVWKPYFTEVSQLGTYYFGMNVKLTPFQDSRVRRAFSHAVDKRSITKYIKAGRVREARGPLPPDIRGYNASLRIPEYDPERAEELLDEAGYERNPETGIREGLGDVPILIPPGRDHLRITRALQANLADIGVVSYPKVNDWKTHLDIVHQGKAPFFRLGWVADYPDADNFLYYQFYSGNIGQSNGVCYSNPEVDELLVEARRSTNPWRRLKLYRKAEQIIADDCVWICVFYFTTSLLRQPFVHGINLTPLGDHMIWFKEVWLSPAATAPAALPPAG